MAEGSNNYISLQDATRYCDYSQEYLSLRARQGKLKAVKFGRNWVTKKEWLDDYFGKVEEYNNHLNNKKFVAPPENLPVAPHRFWSKAVRGAFVMALAFVFVASGCVFALRQAQGNPELAEWIGKESFKNVYEDISPLVQNFSEGFDIGIAKEIENLKAKGDEINLIFTFAGINASLVADDVSEYTYIVGGAGDIIVGGTLEVLVNTLSDIPQSFAVVSEDINGAVSKLGENTAKISLPEISLKKWFSSQTEEIVDGVNLIPEILGEKYFATNEFLEEKISQGWQGIKSYGSQTSLVLKEGYGALIQPWRVPLEKVPEEVITVKEVVEKEVVKEVVKEVEVSKVTKVEPIKGVTKEVIKIDDKELSKIKTQLADITLWGADIDNLREITKKLQATPAYTPVASAPIYIGYQGIQVGGTGTFASLGVSGTAGIGDLGVGGSTNLGTTSSNTLTVNATSTFESLVTAENDLAVGGNVTISGTLTTAGGTFFLSPLAITSTTTPQLSVRYNGSNKLDISVSSAGVVTLDASSGEIQAATGDAFYTEGGNPIRKKGEELLRSSVSIFRYGMPTQTASDTFIQISKYFANTTDISLPAVLTGTTRVYRLVINYADDIAVASTSSWQIVNAAGTTTYDTFTLPGQALASLEEGKPRITGLLTIPATDWQVEVKVPAGKTIRIFQIYLVAYDQIN